MNGASEIPAKIQSLKHTEVRQIFSEPTLIEIEGKNTDEWVFLSTLLHGNEPASFEVLKLLQKHLETHPIKRSLMIFVGNVEAAEKNKRYLPHQSDYNRVWSKGASPEHQLIAEVKKRAQSKKLFASLDIHNNTGSNPFYACINKKSMDHLKLASLFGNQIVFFENPKTVQSMAFSEFCPATTIECGRAENPDGPPKAFEFLMALLQLDKIPENVANANELQVYETQGRILAQPEKVHFQPELEHWNFRSLPEGFPFAESTSPEAMQIIDADENRITSDFIRHDGNSFYLTQAMVPAMLTANTEIIKQDCLGYLMRPLKWQSFR